MPICKMYIEVAEFSVDSNHPKYQMWCNYRSKLVTTAVVVCRRVRQFSWYVGGLGGFYTMSVDLAVVTICQWVRPLLE